MLPVAIQFATGAIAAAPNPAATFHNVCSVCHGDKGEGLVGPALKPLPIPARDVRAVVRAGSGQMPPFSAADLPDVELDALIVYLETWR